MQIVDAKDEAEETTVDIKKEWFLFISSSLDQNEAQWET